MTTYIIRDGKLVLKPAVHRGEPRLQIGVFKSFDSPIDGKSIGNRNALSAHNRFHDVEQIGTETKYFQEQKRKIELQDSKDLDNDIRRAIHETK